MKCAVKINCSGLQECHDPYLPTQIDISTMGLQQRIARRKLVTDIVSTETLKHASDPENLITIYGCIE